VAALLGGGAAGAVVLFSAMAVLFEWRRRSFRRAPFRRGSTALFVR
jgi:hypothetical protein